MIAWVFRILLYQEEMSYATIKERNHEESKKCGAYWIVTKKGNV